MAGAFLELAQPSIDDAAASCVADGRSVWCSYRIFSRPACTFAATWRMHNNV